MDYFNFKAEYESLLEYTDKSNKILAYIKDLLNNYYKTKDQALNTIKKSFDYLLVEMNKPFKSTYDIKYFSSTHKSIKEFISILNVSLNNEITQNNKLQTDIIQQINDYIKFIGNKNYSVLNDFKKLIDKVYYQKKEYELSKLDYINYGKQVTIFEEKISHKMNETLNNNSINSSMTISTNSNDIEIEEENKLAEQLRQLKKIFRQKENNYKQITQDTNMLYTAKNEEYFKILEKFVENEESKDNCFKCYFEKYSYHLKNTLKLSNTVMEYANSMLKKIYENNNKEIFKNIFLVNNKTRIKQEEFIDYEIYKAQLVNIINKNRMLSKEDANNNNRLNMSLQDIFNYEYKVNNNNFNEDEKLIIEQLFLMDEIDKFKFEQFCQKIKNEEKFAKNFIDTILKKYTSSLGVQILNENNFIKFEKILNSILLNINVQKNLFELNFAVAYISEKTFYQDDKNPFYKIYLCKLLMDDNPIIKKKEFWLKLLKLKILSSLENKADKESKKIFKEEKLLEERKLKEKEEKEKLSNSTYDTNYRPSLFEIAGSMVNNIWYGKNYDEKQKNEIRLHEIYNAIYYSKSKEICLKIITEFSTHFSCFCLNSMDVIDILTEVTNEYKITGEEKRIKFLIAKINSNMYSIKNTKFKIISEYIDKNISHLSKFMNKNYLQGSSNIKNKSQILLNVMKYLPITEYKNIITVNKSSFNLIINILYSNLLINIDENIPEEYIKRNPLPNVWKNPELRLKIWKYLLHFKNDINYKQLIIDIQKKENHIEFFDLIEMDVKRMWFEANADEIRNSLNNILCCLAFLHPKIGYSQGMNCIASLLYDVCGSEEEAFNIFNCLLISTDYGDLYYNDLKRLNKYFYVFERLIFIYLPEVYLHLTSTKISPKFFISPWFITLFTNAYKSIKGKDKPKVLIWILDCFIIGGWRAINKIGLCLMKHFEKKILNMDTDELLHFLINDIINYDFFKNENYNGLRNIYDNLQIENGLIENIENEYEIKNIILSENNNNTNEDKPKK